jgi:predicted ATPase
MKSLFESRAGAWPTGGDVSARAMQCAWVMVSPNVCCPGIVHEPRFVSVTGGPGAGKTALLEVIRRHFPGHVAVLPEAASILFAGGFPRTDGLPARRAAQRAIFHVQRELERIAAEERRVALVLCDRGTLDGLAYWPDAEESFFADVGTTREAELSRYAAVLHLRTPTIELGYNHQNPARKESAAEAAAIDLRIVAAWEGHPVRRFIPSRASFLEKLEEGLAFVREMIPPCCLAALAERQAPTV